MTTIVEKPGRYEYGNRHARLRRRRGSASAYGVAHEQIRRVRDRRGWKHVLTVLALAGCLLGVTATTAASAGTTQITASTAAVHHIPRWWAYLWAIEHDKGCWYAWGGNGPCWAGFDCSGLVVDAYNHVGIHLPRTTWEMLASPMLQRIPASMLRDGDLVFMYGGGHVELYTGWWGWTFGAHDQGSRSGFTHWSNLFGFYRVRGAG